MSEVVMLVITAEPPTGFNDTLSIEPTNAAELLNIRYACDPLLTTYTVFLPTVSEGIDVVANAELPPSRRKPELPFVVTTSYSSR